MTDFGPPPSDRPAVPPPPPGMQGMPPPPPSMAPPPGYVPYGGPGAFSPFARVRGIAKALVILQIATVVATAVLLLVQLSLVGKADDFVGDTISSSDFEDAVGPLLLLIVLSGLVAIAALVLLIIWSYRIAGNLQKLGRAPLTWKPGLTIVVWLLGGCTLNIINMLMLGEHWRGSDPEVPPHQNGWRDRPMLPLIPVWFALGLAQIIVGIASGMNSFGGVGVGNDTDSIAESLSDRLPLVIASGLLSLIASVVMILIVRRLTDRHVLATRES